ncbi:thiamine phosphate synthase [bacterium]|nr:thiamine phosphate synthase [bacterium]
MDLSLYVIIDRRMIKGRSPIQVAREAIAGGASAIQLREKELESGDLCHLASSLKKAARKKKALFIVNDRVDIAKACDADGVHLGNKDLPINIARKLLGKKKIIGVTVRNLSQALRAQREGADYVSLGPIFFTKTKKDLPPPQGLKVITRIKGKIKIPLLAIGGINRNNVAQVMRAGADGAAVASAVVRAKNVRKSTKELLRQIKKAKRLKRRN